jgi:RecJ-like exonuclease
MLMKKPVGTVLATESTLDSDALFSWEDVYSALAHCNLSDRRGSFQQDVSVNKSQCHTVEVLSRISEDACEVCNGKGVDAKEEICWHCEGEGTDPTAW